jgi:hypothetical protein
MKEFVSILVYTHSEYSFMWLAMIPLLEKYVKNINIHWLFEETADKDLIDKMVPLHWYKHTYNESLIWTKRVLKALNEIDNEYILFLHEDWLPIGNIELNIINKMVNFMQEKKCGFLLSYSHISVTSRQEGIFTGYEDYYYYSENNHIFQPAIWKKEIFINFCSDLNKSKNQNEDAECLNYMSSKNCWSVQNKETVTTLRTTNSLLFPHMHALSEGLWNFTKYPTLKNFLETFGIDTETRGVHTWWELDTQ